MKWTCTLTVCLALSFLVGCSSTSKTQSGARQSKSEPKSAPKSTPGDWRNELGDLHHKVSTSSPEAQNAFDHGLTLCYGFNHDEAIRSFEKALQLDPNLAMAHWGIAYALGPNYNLPTTPEAEKKAYEHIQQARAHYLVKKLSATGEIESAYIEAMAKRYSADADPKTRKDRDAAYAKAMGKLTKKYTDDLDAATIYAESMMVQNPWRLWSADGTPWEKTEEIVLVLESVLARNPDHIGANHLYIHAVEGSTTPHRALPSADRLPGLCPGAGHLVHMPSHIYIRVGDFDAASTSNEAAIEVDKQYLAGKPADGAYTMMYVPHNIHFLAFSSAMEGRYGDAISNAKELAAYVGPHVKHMADLEGFMPTPEMVYVRFAKWDEALKAPRPEANMRNTTAVWHAMRSMAYAGKGDVSAAEKERAEFKQIRQSIPPEQMFSMLNKAQQVLEIVENTLDARIAIAKKDSKSAASSYRKAIEAQDELVYMEPPDWFIPTRESLGALLLKDGNAEGAEEIFREDLKINSRNGRSLHGLVEALKAQGKTYDAEWVQREFDAAWKNADTKVSLDTM